MRQQDCSKEFRTRESHGRKFGSVCIPHMSLCTYCEARMLLSIKKNAVNKTNAGQAAPAGGISCISARFCSLPSVYRPH